MQWREDHNWDVQVASITKNGVFYMLSCFGQDGRGTYRTKRSVS